MEHDDIIGSCTMEQVPGDDSHFQFGVYLKLDRIGLTLEWTAFLR